MNTITDNEGNHMTHGTDMILASTPPQTEPDEPSLDDASEFRPEWRLLERFTVMEMEGASANDPAVLSQEVEESWLSYIGPDALLLARRINRTLSKLSSSGTGSKAPVEAKKWAADLGYGVGDSALVRLMHARDMLVRYGFAKWSEKDMLMSMLLRWPAIPIAIQTPLHREVLMSIVDAPYSG